MSEPNDEISEPVLYRTEGNSRKKMRKTIESVFILEVVIVVVFENVVLVELHVLNVLRRNLPSIIEGANIFSDALLQTRRLARHSRLNGDPDVEHIVSNTCAIGITLNRVRFNQLGRSTLAGVNNRAIRIFSHLIDIERVRLQSTKDRNEILREVVASLEQSGSGVVVFHTDSMARNGAEIKRGCDSLWTGTRHHSILQSGCHTLRDAQYCSLAVS